MGRSMVLLVVLAAGCGDGRTGRTDASVDAFQYNDAATDAPSCGATGGCTEGPACGTTCCGQGEQCVSGVCMCGTQPSCTDGNTCTIAGPLLPTVCGSTCCGGSMACPI